MSLNRPNPGLLDGNRVFFRTGRCPVFILNYGYHHQLLIYFGKECLVRYFLMSLLLLFALPSMSAPKDDLHAAYTRFLALKSFKASINTTTGTYKSNSVVEFQAPDRYRIVSQGQAPSLIIGGNMYMNINGRSMKVPVPSLKAMLAQYRNPDVLKELEAGVTIESLGSEIINKQATKKYRFTTSKPLLSSNTVILPRNTGHLVKRLVWLQMLPGLNIPVLSEAAFDCNTRRCIQTHALWCHRAC